MIVATVPELCQSYAKNVIFFLKKWMKEIFAYFLDFMLTFNKMQITSTGPIVLNYEHLFDGCFQLTFILCVNRYLGHHIRFWNLSHMRKHL